MSRRSPEGADEHVQPFTRMMIENVDALVTADIHKQPGSRLNLLRHTFTRRLAERGVSMAVIAERLGNSVRVCEHH